MATDRLRLDRLLVKRGLAPTREKARGIILAGLVDVNGQRVDKPGTAVPPDSDIVVRGPEHPWVSRGGVKLAGALEKFDVDPRGHIALDVGASTGGFSHVLLHFGAEKVFCVDVGYGQLHNKLRQDPRVVVIERQNIRHLDPNTISPRAGIAVVDVSFISLSKVLPKIHEVTTPDAHVLALVKPQFEVGKEQVGKGGVVRDPALHRSAVDGVQTAAQELGFTVNGECESPIKGPKGNVEFFLWLQKRGGDG